jgi:hypothetical protein
MCDFDGSWPSKVDRGLVDDPFGLTFLEEGANVVVSGPNGVGKTMIARSPAHEPTGFSSTDPAGSARRE